MSRRKHGTSRAWNVTGGTPRALLRDETSVRITIADHAETHDVLLPFLPRCCRDAVAAALCEVVLRARNQTIGVDCIVR